MSSVYAVWKDKETSLVQVMQSEKDIETSLVQFMQSEKKRET